MLSGAAACVQLCLGACLNRSSATFPRSPQRVSAWRRLFRWLFAPLLVPTVPEADPDPQGSSPTLKVATPTDDTHVLLARAFLNAQRAGHPQCGALHLLDALLDNPDVVDLISAAGGSLAAIRSLLESALDAQERAADVNDGPMGTLVHDAKVMRTRVGQDSVRPVDLLIDATRADAELRHLLERSSVTLLGLRTALVARSETATSGANLEGHLPACVMVHADEFTTQQLVLNVAVGGGGLDAVKALRLAQLLFEHGQVPLCGWTAQEARRRADAMVAVAREKGFPLRVTCHHALAAETLPERITVDPGQTDRTASV